MEAFFQTEIPLPVLLVLAAVMAAVYFYVTRKYKDLVFSESRIKPAVSKTVPAISTGIDPGKVVVIAAAAKAVLDKNKRL